MEKSSGSWIVLLATGLGVGRIKFAPGTWGTFWGLPIAWATSHLPLAGQILVVTALCAAGVPICTLAARKLQLKDPGCVVWDEFAALPIVFLGMPTAQLQQPFMLLIGFVLFRIFDISKVPPGRQLERLPEGWGIMLDDVAAAGYAWAVFWLIRHYI